MIYDFVRHPRSGDVYAVEILRGTRGHITRAAGPLDVAEQREMLAHAPTDRREWLADYLDNADDADAREDGAWLRGEMGWAA